MPPKKKKKAKKDIIAEAELSERVASMCPQLVFDDVAVELVAFGLHPSFAPDSALSHHHHNYIELHAVFDGDGVVIVGEDSFGFSKGQFVVNLPQVVHYWHSGKKLPAMLIMGIKLGNLNVQNPSEIAKLFSSLQNATDVIYTLPKSFEIVYLQLTEELRAGNLGFSVMVRDLVRMMILSLARSTVSKKQIKSTMDLPPAPFNKDAIVDGVNEYIKNHLSEKINLSILANMFHVSRRTLTRHYKQLTGKSIGQRLGELRLTRAEELTRETKLPIKTVAAMCGFTNKSYFAKEFREIYNYSPVEYRDQITQDFEQ